MSSTLFHRLFIFASLLASVFLCACSKASKNNSRSDGTTSAVVSAVVSGTVSSGGGSNVAAREFWRRDREDKRTKPDMFYAPRAPTQKLYLLATRMFPLLTPHAWAATWSCTGSGFGGLGVIYT